MGKCLDFLELYTIFARRCPVVVASERDLDVPQSARSPLVQPPPGVSDPSYTTKYKTLITTKIDPSNTLPEGAKTSNQTQLNLYNNF